MSTSRSIAILAGNPLVTITEDGRLRHEPQQDAFEEGLRFADTVRDQIGRIYVLFDHPGSSRDFSRQFFDPSLKANDAKRKRPTLDYLLPEIRKAYTALASTYRFSLANIHVLLESICRVEMLQLARDSEIQSSVRLIDTGCESVCGTIDSGRKLDPDRPHVNCNGILTASLLHLARHGNEVHVFEERDELRCNPATLVFASWAARELGFQGAITHTVLQGKPDQKHYKIIHFPPHSTEYSITHEARD